MSEAERTYRATDLATAAGISVQLLRSYQSKGLIDPPRHEGRVAWYGDAHLERLRWIRDLKDRGYSLKMVGEAVRADDETSEVPTGLEPPPAATLRLRDVAERSGLPIPMLRALEASHLLRPHRIGRTYRYTEADVRAVRQVLTLLSVGMPLEEFLQIAEPQLVTADDLATGAVAVWMRQVADRAREAGLAEAESAARVVASVRVMVAAISGLVAYNVERAVLNEAQAALKRHGDASWVDALTHEVERRHPDVAV